MGTKTTSQNDPHKPTENRGTELEIHTHFVNEKYTYFKGLDPHPKKKQNQKMQSESRSDLLNALKY